MWCKAYSVYSELFPAYAGVILFFRNCLVYDNPFPRVCGGDPGTKIFEGDIISFSPRMRG